MKKMLVYGLLSIMIFGCKMRKPQATSNNIGFVRVLSPNGNEVLKVGSILKIRWETSSNIDNILIGYSFGPGSLNWIVFGIKNTGHFEWKVNVGNHTYPTKIKIYIAGYHTGKGSAEDFSDKEITIIN